MAVAACLDLPVIIALSGMMPSIGDWLLKNQSKLSLMPHLFLLLMMLMKVSC